MRREKNEILNIYNLTPMQEGMLFHYLSDRKEDPYKVQFHITLEGKVDEKLLEKSFRELVRKHDVLRTAIVYSKMKRPRQVALKERGLDFKEIDFRQYGEAAGSRLLKKYIEKDWKTGFDLTGDMLIRMALIQMEADEHVLLITCHHIIMDGWSAGLLLKDLFMIYKQLKQDNRIEPGQKYSYENYLRWLDKQDKKEGHSYWKRYLAGCEGTTGLSVLEKKETDEEKSYDKRDYKIVIEKQLTQGLEQVARAAGAALNNVLQAVWAILLQGYTNNEDVVFGNVVSGRPGEIEDVENIIGLFINTIPLRVRPRQDQTFTGLVKELRDIFIECNKYGYLELAEIEKNIDTSEKIIDHLYVLENHPVDKSITDKEWFAGSGLEITSLRWKDQTHYNFNLVILPGKELVVNLSHNANAFEEERIRQIAGHIQKVLQEVVKNPEKPIREIEVVTEEEKSKLLYTFNDTAAAYPQEKTIHQLFEEQVEKTPDHIAVVGPKLQITNHKTSCISYKELNKKANRLAGLLMEKGVKPDTIVGIIVEPSVEMIAGILGILKSGAAYLPIDPDYPQERINYLLADSGAKLVVTAHSLTDKPVLPVPSVAKKQPAASLAYIIYTSGTTGRSKG